MVYTADQEGLGDAVVLPQKARAEEPDVAMNRSGLIICPLVIQQGMTRWAFSKVHHE